MYTARLLLKEKTPFHIVVEPQDVDAYSRVYGEAFVLSLPWDDPGSVIPARNWCKEHAIANGYAWHWQLDDDIMRISNWNKRKQVTCQAAWAFSYVERFVERYVNIGIAGLRPGVYGAVQTKPFQLNTSVCTCFIVRSDEYRWRGTYLEDVDYTMQVLSGGECTVQFNAFSYAAKPTMVAKGGNTDLYQDDGRARNVRALRRQWPHLFKMERGVNHLPKERLIKGWKKFDTKLIRRARDDI